MYKLYCSTTTGLKSRNNEEQNVQKNITTTTGFFSHSRIQTTSSDIQDKPYLNTSPSIKTEKTHLYRGALQTDKIKSFGNVNNNKERFSRNKTAFIQRQITPNATQCKKHEMRKLKLKLHKLINIKASTICSNFECKNEFFNRKLNDYFHTESYVNHKINYHKKFHFNKYDLGEAHNRFDMVMNLNYDKDYFKRQQKLMRDDFEKKFTEKEKKEIKLDPFYYITNNKLSNQIGISKHRKLVDKINAEEYEEMKELQKKQKKNNKHLRNKKRYMTAEHKRILTEITLLKDSELDDIKLNIENNRSIESKKHLHLRTKSVRKESQRHINKLKTKKIANNKSNGVINMDVFDYIKQAINKSHNQQIKDYHKEKKRKNEIEKEFVDLNSKILCLDKKIYKRMPIIKEQNLTEVCKKDYSLLLNYKQLRKLERFVEKENYQEELNKHRRLENEFINNYTTKLQNQYKNINNSKN